MNTLLSDETGVETNAGNDESGQTKIFTILDAPKEVKKVRRKELNSLREKERRDSCEAIISNWQMSDTDAMG